MRKVLLLATGLFVMARSSVAAEPFPWSEANPPPVDDTVAISLSPGGTLLAVHLGPKSCVIHPVGVHGAYSPDTVEFARRLFHDGGLSWWPEANALPRHALVAYRVKTYLGSDGTDYGVYEDVRYARSLRVGSLRQPGPDAWIIRVMAMACPPILGNRDAWISLLENRSWPADHAIWVRFLTEWVMSIDKPPSHERLWDAALACERRRQECPAFVDMVYEKAEAP